MTRPGRTESGREPDQQRRHRSATDPAREAAAETLRLVTEEDAYANLVLPQVLQRHGLQGRDAAFATELAYGTLRLQGRYDAILARCTGRRPLAKVDPPVLRLLRLGAHQLLGMRVAPHAAVDETVALLRGPKQSARGFLNAVLRQVAGRSRHEWLTALADTGSHMQVLARTESHPEWICHAYVEALAAHGRSPEELADALRANNEPARVTLAARPGLVGPDELDADIANSTGKAATAGRWAPTAHHLNGGHPAEVASVAEGRAGVQDEGSQLAALALLAAPLDNAGRDDQWLDMTAGPGGKAVLLAALAQQRGAHLLANEIAEHRARLVTDSLKALDPTTVSVRTGDARDLPTDYPANFDRILLDAPCTGLGSLRRRPEARWRRSEHDVEALVTLQTELLHAAIRTLREGGVVAYVTCTPHVAETLAVVASVLGAREDVVLLDTPSLLDDLTRHPLPRPDNATQSPGVGRSPTEQEAARFSVQLWPHVHGTDAMYIAVMQRRAS